MNVAARMSAREVLYGPLQQAMVLLWLFGMLHLISRLFDGATTVVWLVGAGVATLASVLLVGHFRVPRLAVVPLSIGLAAVLVLLHLLGGDDPATQAAGAASYALLAWYLCAWGLAHPASALVARLLGFRGDAGTAGAAEVSIHWGAFSIAVLAVALPLVLGPPGAFWRGELPISLLAPIAPAMTFIWLAGRRYDSRLHSYSFLFLLGLGSLWAFIQVQGQAPDGAADLVRDPRLGLAAVLLGTASWLVAAVVLDRRGGQASFDTSLYRKPLRVFAATLGLAAAAQQLALALADPQSASYAGGAILLTSGLSILLANHALASRGLSFAAVLIIASAVVGLEGVWAARGDAPAYALAASSDFLHLGFVLAAIALITATFARGLSNRLGCPGFYPGPMLWVAGIAWIVALIVVVPGYVPAVLDGDPMLIGTMGILAAGVFPWLGATGFAARLRGVAVALLATGAVQGALAVVGVSPLSTIAGIGWGFALWALGDLLLPRFAARWPRWAVSGTIWPWLGLGLVVLATATELWRPEPSWVFLAAAGLYLFLMLRDSPSPAFPWLAVGALTVAGVGVTGNWVLEWPWNGRLTLDAMPLVPVFLWLNALLVCGALWRHHGAIWAERLGWQRRELETPFLVVPFVVLAAILARLVEIEALWISGLFQHAYLAPPATAIALGVLLAASFVHALHHRVSTLLSHVVLFSFTVAVLALVMALPNGHARLPLAVALWSFIVLAMSIAPWPAWRGAVWQRLRAAGGEWARLLFAVGSVSLLLTQRVPPVESMVAWTLLAATALGVGWWRMHRGWLAAGGLVALFCTYGWWSVWLRADDLFRVLPWYALQSAVLLWISGWGRARIADHVVTGQPGTSSARLENLVWLLGAAHPVLVTAALLALTVHGVLIVESLGQGHSVSWLAGAADPVAAVAAVALMSAKGILRARRAVEDRWIYAVALLIGATGVYLRYLWVGAIPVTPWDTAAIMAAAYGVFILQRLTLSVPTYHIALVLPLVALATAPLQAASVTTGNTLLAAALLYLVMRATTANPIPLYLGVLALNAAVYLWVPQWEARSGLFQLYVLPAAVSVLVLLHLHRRELRPRVLNGARLAALVTLFAGAGVDLLLQRQELMVFVLALGLSLASIGIGVALRIRVFLYTGVAFLVLNVLGQLVHFYPEQQLAKAVVLIVLGMFITGGMLLFNIKREAILARVRIFRADLEAWE